MSLLVALSHRIYFILGVSIFVNLLFFAQYYRAVHRPVNSPLAVPSSQSPSQTQETHAFPSKIWQTWKDDSEDPTDRSSGLPHQWRVMNPEHRYERITDANANTFVRDHFPSTTADLFSSLADPILKADFLRYLILYSTGGVWADIDVQPMQPVSNWVPKEFQTANINLVVGIENDHHKQPIWRNSPYSVQLSQYTVLAKPNHPALGKLIAKVEQNLVKLLESKVGGGRITFEDVMSNTGPFVFTDILMNHFTDVTGVKHTGDELDSLKEPKLIGDVLVLPIEAFGWLEHEHAGQEIAETVLVKHLFMGSWRGSHPG